MTTPTRFKGGTLLNRYKITGTLTTISPLHIGDGEMVSNESRLPKIEGEEEAPKFSTVCTDVDQRAYVPGSTLKGNLRSWLAQVFSPAAFAHKNLARVNSADYMAGLLNTSQELRRKGRADFHRKLSDSLAMTDLLFGSAVNEGKLEVWDAPLAGPLPALEHSASACCGYDPVRGTILLKSVAIDPEHGTAAKSKLFNYEVVPPGAGFDLTICGQNLSNDELGMLLFALQGFDSGIYPVTLGAMGSVGYGRMQFSLGKVHVLDAENSRIWQAWLADAVRNGHAGYTNIPALDSVACRQAVDDFRKVFADRVERGAP